MKMHLNSVIKVGRFFFKSEDCYMQVFSVNLQVMRILFSRLSLACSKRASEGL